VTDGALPIPKELSPQKVVADRMIRIYQASCRMWYAADDGKVDKEPKYWFNTCTGLVSERSFKFPTEVTLTLLELD
jgi:hypothetical protein